MFILCGGASTKENGASTKENGASTKEHVVLDCSGSSTLICRSTVMFLVN